MYIVQPIVPLVHTLFRAYQHTKAFIQRRPSHRYPRPIPLLLLLLLNQLILIIIILARIRHLVLEHLDELVEHHRKHGPQAGPHPVDPVLDVEDARDDAGPEAARGVERAARVVDADQLGDEEGEADADGSDEGCWTVSI